ncbi:MAG: hypothetical protein KAH32_02690 [Chlamydiia bacterium]|nr:hypothetical protein [Chlamydiia bacterium]
MAKLAKVEALRLRLSLHDIDDINDQASAALEAATLHLISALRTEFVRQEVVDLFWIDPIQEPWVGDFIELYQTQGYVFEDAGAMPTPIVTDVRIAEYIGGLASADILPDTVLLKNLNKGLVMLVGENDGDIRLPTYRHSNKFYVQVAYTAGFETSTDKYGKNYKLVPDWLEEAAILQATTIFNSGCDGGGKSKTTCCSADVLSLIARYIRYYPYARKVIM